MAHLPAVLATEALPVGKAWLVATGDLAFTRRTPWLAHVGGRRIRTTPVGLGLVLLLVLVIVGLVLRAAWATFPAAAEAIAVAFQPPSRRGTFQLRQPWIPSPCIMRARILHAWRDLPLATIGSCLGHLPCRFYLLPPRNRWLNLLRCWGHRGCLVASIALSIHESRTRF